MPFGLLIPEHIKYLQRNIEAVSQIAIPQNLNRELCNKPVRAAGGQPKKGLLLGAILRLDQKRQFIIRQGRDTVGDFPQRYWL